VGFNAGRFLEKFSEVELNRPFSTLASLKYNSNYLKLLPWYRKLTISVLTTINNLRTRTA
jgi:hypothetical protein